MKKKIIIIVSIIVSLLIISGIVTTIILLNKDEKKPKSENKAKYVLLENSNMTYKYVSTYKEYLKLMEDEEITKEDDYVAFSKDDFKNQKYLFVIVPFD